MSPNQRAHRTARRLSACWGRIQAATATTASRSTNVLIMQQGKGLESVLYTLSTDYF